MDDKTVTTVEPVLVPWWPDAGRALGGLSRTKTHNLIRSGELPSMTIGRRRFVAVRDLHEYVERRLAVAQSGNAA